MAKFFPSFVALCLLTLATGPAAAAAEPTSGDGPAGPQSTAANVMVEFVFHSAKTYDDPFNAVTLDVDFVDPAGHTLRVPAFWGVGRRGACAMRRAFPASIGTRRGVPTGPIRVSIRSAAS